MSQTDIDQLNKQQWKILAYIDLGIGIISLVAMIALSLRVLHGFQDFEDFIIHPYKRTIYIVIFTVFLVSIITDIVLAALMLRASEKIVRNTKHGKIIVYAKLFLFLVALGGVIILFMFFNLIVAVIGVIILKYKLYSLWVYWSCSNKTNTSSQDSDKIFIVDNLLEDNDYL